MPRKARIDAPGAVQHIIIRGIERKDIFRDNTDKDTFIERFGKIVVQTSTPCYAWVLMDNHVHLLLRTGRVPIATLMRRLLTGYAQYFNRRHKRHGQLFQNRYKSFLCYLCVQKLGISGAEVARRLNISPFAVSKAVLRGQKRVENDISSEYENFLKILPVAGNLILRPL